MTTTQHLALEKLSFASGFVYGFRLQTRVVEDVDGATYRIDHLNSRADGTIRAWMIKQTKTGRDYSRGNSMYLTLDTLAAGELVRSAVVSAGGFSAYR